MLECILGGDSLIRIMDEHLFEQVEAVCTESWNVVAQVLLLILREVGLVLRQLRDAGPLVSSRGASDLKDFKKLVILVAAWEEWLLSDDLCEDAADGPDVDRGVVVLGTHEDVGGSVPQGHHFVREVLYRNTEGTGQTEIGELQHVLPVDQQVLWFQVSVQHLVLVALRCSVQELVQE